MAELLLFEFELFTGGPCDIERVAMDGESDLLAGYVLFDEPLGVLFLETSDFEPFAATPDVK